MIPVQVLHDRLRNGWSDHEAATRPVRCPRWRWLAEQRLGYSVTRAISEMRSEGHTGAFMAVQLGCCHNTVWRVENGQQ